MTPLEQGERAIILTFDRGCTFALKEHTDFTEMCPINQNLIFLVLLTFVEQRVRIQMVSFHGDGEFSLANEVHEGLFLIKNTWLSLIFVFGNLPVKFGFVLLLKIDYIRTGENAFKFDNKESDALIGLFLLVNSNLLD